MTKTALDLSGLNGRQREAVVHGEGPLLVLAGAGSGKTQVIIFRMARLIRCGTPPERILGVTFTNKAAREMRQRLQRLCGRAASKITLVTFHALGLQILKEEAGSVGLRAGFCIYDTGDQLSMVRELMREVKVADRRLDAAKVLAILLKTKRERRQDVELLWGDDYELAAFDLFPRYCARLRSYNAVDFDDLILLAQDALRQDSVRSRWEARYDHLLVDEYQDTSPDQLALVRMLAGVRQNVCAVGDDDQSIYAWRGALVDNILSFGRHFSGTQEVVLEQNYRSTGHILSVANAVIRHNAKRKSKALWSADGVGDPVEEVCALDGEDEATFVCETTARLIYDGVPAHDIAVLYRANVQSRIFEETLGFERIPFRVVGGQAFFDRKEVRDVVAFLSVIHNPRDEIALRRVINVPPRGIGPSSLERLSAYGDAHDIGLWEALRTGDALGQLPKQAREGVTTFVALVTAAQQGWAGQRVGFAAGVEALIEELALRAYILDADDAPSIKERRLENLGAVVRSVTRFEAAYGGAGPPLGEFLRSSALVREPAEAGDEATAGQVTLMTLHSAKGLEFPYVFLVGLEDDLLPHRRALEMGGDVAEERRLCYVGMTRARRRLWLVWAEKRMRHGKRVERSPSRFLQEIPGGDHIRRWRRGDGGSAAEEDNDAMAREFFRQMKSQLGMDDDP